MNHIFHIPDDIFVKVAEYAKQHEQTPDKVFLQAIGAYLAAEQEADNDLFVEGYDPALDPLARFAGKYEAIAPDVTQRHDAYLADE